MQNDNKHSSWKNKVNTPGDKDFFVGDDAKYKESIGRDDYGIELVSSSYNEKKWERAMEACQKAENPPAQEVLLPVWNICAGIRPCILELIFLPVSPQINSLLCG